MNDIFDLIASVDKFVLFWIILVIFILQTPILTFPIFILAILIGFVYGTLIGGLINSIGFFLAASLGYEIGRYFNFASKGTTNSKIKTFEA